VKKKSEGMSIFIVDLREADRQRPDRAADPNLVNHETNELFFDNLEIPAENLIGEEGAASSTSSTASTPSAR
jgi:acyl-CoA dehydrogenase